MKSTHLAQIIITVALLGANWMLWQKQTIYLYYPPTKSLIAANITLPRTADDIARGLLPAPEIQNKDTVKKIAEGHTIRSQLSKLQAARIELQLQLLTESQTLLEEYK